ncbi:MAG TPA: hypothetical protein VN703_00030 [Candidatus Sulfopaludibacter sp.]|nr:hypothetical protein [Candidatus Sulfopaludibacter sp.]
MHYWIGSKNNPQMYYNNYYYKFNIISDNIKILEEYENYIPDKSWMLYLLEVFNTQQIAVEINLICQFDEQNYFEAILDGINRYRFTKVIPIVGHKYLRQIKFNKLNSSLEYYLKNLNTQTDEIYTFILQPDLLFSFQFSTCFTGIEWWNKIENKPYPIKYKIEISELMYGFNDNPYDTNSIVFFPINSLISDKDDGSSNLSYYPIEFNYSGIRNGCFCYKVQTGYCSHGLNCSFI